MVTKTVYSLTFLLHQNQRLWKACCLNLVQCSFTIRFTLLLSLFDLSVYAIFQALAFFLCRPLLYFIPPPLMSSVYKFFFSVMDVWFSKSNEVYHGGLAASSRKSGRRAPLNFPIKAKNPPVYTKGFLAQSYKLETGSYLSSRAVTSQVLSAYKSLTSVFGMGTGVPLSYRHRKLN